MFVVNYLILIPFGYRNTELLVGIVCVLNSLKGRNSVLPYMWSFHIPTKDILRNVVQSD